MLNDLQEYYALQAILKVKQLAHDHNLMIDDLKATLKKSISFSYHLCIDDVLKHYYV